MNLESRIERLEQAAPTDIVLYLADGSEFRFIHGARKFVWAALAQVADGGGPIIDACRNAVTATRSVGLLHEVFAAMVEPEEGERKHANQGGRKSSGGTADGDVRNGNRRQKR